MIGLLGILMVVRSSNDEYSVALYGRCGSIETDLFMSSNTKWGRELQNLSVII